MIEINLFLQIESFSNRLRKSLIILSNHFLPLLNHRRIRGSSVHVEAMNGFSSSSANVSCTFFYLIDETNIFVRHSIRRHSNIDHHFRVSHRNSTIYDRILLNQNPYVLDAFRNSNAQSTVTILIFSNCRVLSVCCIRSTIISQCHGLPIFDIHYELRSVIAIHRCVNVYCNRKGIYLRHFVWKNDVSVFRVLDVINSADDDAGRSIIRKKTKVYLNEMSAHISKFICRWVSLSHNHYILPIESPPPPPFTVQPIVYSSPLQELLSLYSLKDDIRLFSSPFF